MTTPHPGRKRGKASGRSRGAAPIDRKAKPRPMGVRILPPIGTFEISPYVDDRPTSVAILAALRAALPKLRKLLARCNDHWVYEDYIYRFYSQSFKVYWLQAETASIVKALRALAPKRELDPRFEEIVARGTGKNFELDHNNRWIQEAAPIVEAFFHARFFLEMAVRYGEQLERPPAPMPSGWAALLGVLKSW